MNSLQSDRNDGSSQIQAIRPDTTNLHRPIYALQEEDGAPGLYKLLICDVENMNNLDSADTPPPSYRKYDLPILRVEIPTEDTERPPSSSPHTDDSQGSQSEWSNLQYVSRTFLEQNWPKSEGMHQSKIYSNKNTKNLLERVRWIFKKCERGIKIRMNRSDKDIIRKMPEIRLERISVPVSPSSTEKSPANVNGSREIDQSPVFELDGQPILSPDNEMDSHANSIPQMLSAVSPELNMEVLGKVENDPIVFQHEMSSIVPTPKSGLPLRLEDNSWSSPISPEDLDNRLRLIAQPPLENGAEPISSCPPGVESRLRRANAFSDQHGKPGNPQALEDKCQTSSFCPTAKEASFDTKQRSLPKLILPANPILGSSRKQTTQSMSPWPLNGESFDDGFSGKEVFVSPIAAGEFNSPSIDLNGKHLEAVSETRSAVSVSTPNAIYHPEPMGRYHSQTNPIMCFIADISKAFLDSIIHSVSALRDCYGPEPPIPDGHVRVRWICRCGEHLYDDYQENRPGAAAELQAYLNHAPYQWPTSPYSSDPSSAGGSIFSANGLDPLSPQSSWPSPSSKTPLTPWNSPNFSRQPAGATPSSSIPFNVSFRPYVEPLWLFTCLNEGKWTTKMRHLDVNNSKIISDKDLALALRSLYNQVNRKWYKFLKLRGLTNIRFVQFELHRNRYADILRVPSLPALGASDYVFQPTELVPPVGSTYLMHLFKHPEEYDDELITYFRTPKRRGRLEVGTGWGLQLVEGFLPERVWALVFGLFGLASLVFGVVWAVMRNDVQGAFGVAGWMLTATTLVMAWVQTWVD